MQIRHLHSKSCSRYIPIILGAVAVMRLAGIRTAKRMLANALIFLFYRCFEL